MPIITFPITLIEAFMITPGVKHFRFECSLAPPFQFIPGQFITIHFEYEGKSLKRSYSIANEPNEDQCIEFAAGYVEQGPGTQLLFNLKPKDTIQISGPYGRLILRENGPKRYVLVATSTGITPFRSMLSELGKRLKEDPNLKVVILQGVQKREDLLYGQDFLNFVQKYPSVCFRPCFSREDPQTLQEDEFRGYVQKTFSDLDLQCEEDLVYLCGNPSMIDDAFNDLKARGFTTQQVIREKYISN